MKLNGKATREWLEQFRGHYRLYLDGKGDACFVDAYTILKKLAWAEVETSPQVQEVLKSFRVEVVRLGFKHCQRLLRAIQTSLAVDELTFFGKATETEGASGNAG